MGNKKNGQKMTEKVVGQKANAREINSGHNKTHNQNLDRRKKRRKANAIDLVPSLNEIRLNIWLCKYMHPIESLSSPSVRFAAIVVQAH